MQTRIGQSPGLPAPEPVKKKEKILFNATGVVACAEQLLNFQESGLEGLTSGGDPTRGDRIDYLRKVIDEAVKPQGSIQAVDIAKELVFKGTQRSEKIMLAIFPRYTLEQIREMLEVAREELQKDNQKI